MKPYTGTAISLHWIIALLIVAGFGLGLTMTGMPFSPQKLKFYSWHKWIGITVFTLAAARLLWRLYHPAPELPSAMPDWQKKAAHGAHYALYALFFLIPVTGWLFSSSVGVQTVYLSWLPLPDLISKDTGDIVLFLADAPKPFTVAELIRVTHKTLNFSMAFVVVLHIAAALKHHLVDRDEVMLQMAPVLRRFARKPAGIQPEEIQ